MVKCTESYEKQLEHNEEDERSFDKLKVKTKHQLSFLNQYINKYKTTLKNLLNENVGITRIVRNEKIYDKNGEPALKRRVSIFDSNLTRCFVLRVR